MRIAFFLAFLCVANVEAQEGVVDARQKSLQVVPEWDGRKLKLSGTVDMPEGTVLRTLFFTETERMFMHKAECKMYTEVTQNNDVHLYSVKKNKKFEYVLEMSVPGIYSYSVEYNYLEQVLPEVVKELGEGYPNWKREFSATLFEPGALLRTLVEEQPKLNAFLRELKKIADLITREYQRSRESRDFKEINAELSSLEKEILTYRASTVYVCTCDIIYETLQKMHGCAPDIPKRDFPVGSPDALHAAEGQADIPEGVNDEWQLELVLAYIARAKRAMDRERFLLPLRYAGVRWEQYLQLIKIPEITNSQLDKAKTEWGRAQECVKDNCKAIESDLPSDKKKRSAEETMFGEWCTSIEELLVSMDAYVAKRRDARTSPEEERTKLDNEAEKEVRKQWDGVNGSIRRVPSRP